MTTKRKPTRRGRRASAGANRTHEIVLSESIAHALTADLQAARSKLLDIKNGEGDSAGNWLGVLLTLRELEIVLLAAMARAHVEAS